MKSFVSDDYDSIKEAVCAAKLAGGGIVYIGDNFIDEPLILPDGVSINGGYPRPSALAESTIQLSWKLFRKKMGVFP